MRILITGSTGLIGTRIIELLGAKYTFIPLLQSEVDITDKAAVARRLSTVDFDLLLHLAAYTNVDGAEKQKDLCRAINVDGTRNLLEACERKGAKMIYISTDFVFDGKPVLPSLGKVSESQQMYPSLGKVPGSQQMYPSLGKVPGSQQMYPSLGKVPEGGKGLRIHPYNSKLVKLAKEKRATMTASEVKLWTLLKNDAMGYDFHRQKVIGDYIVDFYCPELELVIEVDGKVHEYTERTDEERQTYLESLGIAILRIPNEAVKDGIDTWIKTRCDSRKTERHTPSPSFVGSFPKEAQNDPSLGKVSASGGRKGLEIPTYTESSQPNPISHYGQTKYEGEQLVKGKAMIIRPSYPYRKEFEGKRDFVRTIRYLLEQGKTLSMVENSLITPTFIDDIVNGLDYLMQHFSTDIFHLVGADSISPFEAGKLIARTFGLDENLVQPTTYAEYFKGKALRPQWARMVNTNKSLRMNTFLEGLIHLV